MAHLDPQRLEAARAARGMDVTALAAASGIREDLLVGALAGTRRLDGWAMRMLAVPLAVEWTVLRCDHSKTRRRCRSCHATHRLSDENLAPLTQALRDALDSMYQDGDGQVADIADVASATSALRALGGGDLDAAWATVEHLSPTRLAACGGTDAVAHRLAAYVARGDVETTELVGLDVDLPTGLDVPLAGWTLGRLNADVIADFDPIPTQPMSPWWDRDAAEATAWLRRPAGIRPAVSRTTVVVSEPRAVAAAPLLALAIVGDKPPTAISHGWAQSGRGVSLAAGSRELDYARHTDGLP
jgi:hypothetical protein